MGNSLRCCLACVLPCGALDLIRIVHLSGRVDEYGHAVSAGEVLAAHPNHVLSRPRASSSSGQQGRARILIVSPESELERGEIYFLIPAASVPDGKKKPRPGARARTSTEADAGSRHHNHVRSKSESSAAAVVVVDDRLRLGGASLSSPETQRNSKSTSQSQQHRRRMSTGSHGASWQPHLARIAEDP